MKWMGTLFVSNAPKYASWQNENGYFGYAKTSSVLLCTVVFIIAIFLWYSNCFWQMNKNKVIFIFKLQLWPVQKSPQKVMSFHLNLVAGSVDGGVLSVRKNYDKIGTWTVPPPGLWPALSREPTLDLPSQLSLNVSILRHQKGKRRMLLQHDKHELFFFSDKEVLFKFLQWMWSPRTNHTNVGQNTRTRNKLFVSAFVRQTFQTQSTFSAETFLVSGCSDLELRTNMVLVKRHEKVRTNPLERQQSLWTWKRHVQKTQKTNKSLLQKNNQHIQQRSTRSYKHGFIVFPKTEPAWNVTFNLCRVLLPLPLKFSALVPWRNRVGERQMYTYLLSFLGTKWQWLTSVVSKLYFMENFPQPVAYFFLGGEVKVANIDLADFSPRVKGSGLGEWKS